jgi:hypothetical protein
MQHRAATALLCVVAAGGVACSVEAPRAAGDATSSESEGRADEAGADEPASLAESLSVASGGRARLGLHPRETRHDFGTVAAGSTTPPWRLELKSKGTTKVVPSIVLTGDNASAFSLQTDGCDGHPLTKHNRTCAVGVVFAPPADGTYTATLSITAPGAKAHEVTLVGATPGTTGGTPEAPTVTLSSTHLDFGSLPVGAGMLQAGLTLSLSASSPKYLVPVITGPDADEFVAAESPFYGGTGSGPDVPATIETVSFVPTRSGPAQATLTFQVMPAGPDTTFAMAKQETPLASSASVALAATAAWGAGSSTALAFVAGLPYTQGAAGDTQEFRVTNRSSADSDPFEFAVGPCPDSNPDHLAVTANDDYSVFTPAPGNDLAGSWTSTLYTNTSNGNDCMPTLEGTSQDGVPCSDGCTDAPIAAGESCTLYVQYTKVSDWLCLSWDGSTAVPIGPTCTQPYGACLVAIDGATIVAWTNVGP